MVRIDASPLCWESDHSVASEIFVDSNYSSPRDGNASFYSCACGPGLADEGIMSSRTSRSALFRAAAVLTQIDTLDPLAKDIAEGNGSHSEGDDDKEYQKHGPEFPLKLFPSVGVGGRLNVSSF